MTPSTYPIDFQMIHGDEYDTGYVQNFTGRFCVQYGRCIRQNKISPKAAGVELGTVSRNHRTCAYIL